MLKEFCERFRQLRLDKEISQMNLAKIFNVAQQTVDKWERGITEPSMEMIVRLALYFEVPAGYLLGLENLDGTKNRERGNSSVSATIIQNGHGNKVSQNIRK